MQVELLQWQMSRDAEGVPVPDWRALQAGVTPMARGDVPADAVTLVLCFGPTDRLQAEPVYPSLRARYPAAVIACCSSGTQTFDAELDDDAVVASVIHLERSRMHAVCAPITDAAQSQDCGAELGARLRMADPADDLALVIVLSDGSSVNGTRLIGGLGAALGPTVPIVGGLAGDGARFQTTLVGLDGPAQPGQVVAIGLYGRELCHGVAAVGGWDAFGPPRRVTRASGNVLHELDGSPALDLYERYLGEEAEGLPGSALLYPLRIWQPDRPDTDVVRTVLAIDRQTRSMTFAGDIPEGWSAQLMRGSHDRLIAGAEQAAKGALAGLPAAGASDTLALLVSCVGRRLLMGQRTADEVEAVQQAVQARLGERARCIGF
ncbi:MAG: hypothetical protein RLY71_1914, partial [Pseudomonadota bacterium]